MVQLGASVYEVQDASISDAPTPDQLQPRQQRTVTGDESEAAIRGPGDTREADTTHTRGPHTTLRSTPDKSGQD